MQKGKPDTLLLEIEEMMKFKPKEPTFEWYGDFTRLLAYAPLKLKVEHPLQGDDGHNYLPFILPGSEEIADVDYSQYTLAEQAENLVEMSCGALILSSEKETLWSFSLGSMINLNREKHPYKQEDPRKWTWPANPKNIKRLTGEEACLPQETNLAIKKFLSQVHPAINTWGLATCNKGITMFIEPSLPVKDANPNTILDFLKWFTPHHYCWNALE